MHTYCTRACGILNTMKKIGCKECKGPMERPTYFYCSNKCHARYQYRKYINEWKHGLASGNRGIFTRNISKHLKRFLMETHGEKCSLCGWNKKHPITKAVPVEVDHIDGNADNNTEKNLRLLCPNCHALTPSFRNLNRGNGRIWRKLRHG